MEVTPESVRQALTSEDLGDRLRAVNQLRRLEPRTAFPILQTAIADPNARVRYAAVSQMSSLGSQDPDLSLEILRDRLLNDPEMDVQSVAADALAALHLTSAFEDMQTLFHQTSECSCEHLEQARMTAPSCLGMSTLTSWPTFSGNSLSSAVQALQDGHCMVQCRWSDFWYCSSMP